MVAVTGSTVPGETASPRQFTVPGRPDDQALAAGEAVAGLLVIPGDSERPVHVRPLTLTVAAIRQAYRLRRCGRKTRPAGRWRAVESGFLRAA